MNTSENRSQDQSEVQLHRSRLRNMLFGARIASVVSVFAALGLADALAGGARGVSALAQACDASEDALARLLRAAAALELVEVTSTGDFSLTALGEALRSDAPGSLGVLAASVTREDRWRPWGELLRSVRTGGPAFEELFGQSQDAWFADNRDAGVAFDQQMTSVTQDIAKHCAEVLGPSRFDCAIDVGGGQGVLLSAILQQAPAIRGVLFDLPHVVAGASPLLAEAGVTERCTVVGGSFFEAVPEGGDAYLLKWILHGWDDPPCLEILRSCRAAMTGDARLFVIETLLPSGADPQRICLRDLNMLVMGSGRERTLGEYEELLARAGLDVLAVHPTNSLFAIIEAGLRPTA